MAQEQRRYIVDEDGRRRSVVLNLSEYEQLLEDLRDIALIAERRDEPTEPWEKVRGRLEEKWRSTG